MGSVKDLKILEKPTASDPGVGNFVFSDRYSVFDWGEMPDHISDKGKALCIIGAYFFEKLEEMGIRSHYLGLVEDDKVKRLSELTAPSDTMQVKLVQVIKPKVQDTVYDYSMYRNGMSNALIPLEVIYRNTLPQGSSVFKRLESGNLKLEDIGLTEMPQPGDRPEQPILDFSTKLEATDRYIPFDEAKRIAGLTEQEFRLIRKTTEKVNRLITEEVEKMGLDHEDGKIEFGKDQNSQIMLVDVLGTPDECRFTYEGMPVSKEAARIFYRNSSWHKEIETAKNRDRVNWKAHVTSKPPKLPETLERQVSQLYTGFCNGVTGRQWFDTPPLPEVMAEMKKSMQT